MRGEGFAWDANLIDDWRLHNRTQEKFLKVLAKQQQLHTYVGGSGEWSKAYLADWRKNIIFAGNAPKKHVFVEKPGRNIQI